MSLPWFSFASWIRKRVRRTVTTGLAGIELRNDLSGEEMFFVRETGLTRQTQEAYPFSYFDFVQQGQDNRSAKDEYLYIYSPEGAYSNQLLLARVRSGKLEYNEAGEYFGWYSWLPSVVWNEGLGL